MALDVKAYNDPGVYSEDISSPVVATAGISPTELCIVGDTLRGTRATEVVVLTATTPVQLANQGIDQATITVKGRGNGTLYALTTDYVVTKAGGQDTIVGGAGWKDDITSIARAAASTIASGTEVVVSYIYGNPSYYQPMRFTDFDSLVDMYGDPFDANGNVNSELSLAAMLAFRNGAPSVIGLAVAPANYTATLASADWTAAFSTLLSEESIDVIVPVTSDVTIHGLLDAHIAAAMAQDLRRLAFLGYAGSSSDNGLATAKTQAALRDDTRIAAVAPGAVYVTNGAPTGRTLVTGEYVAAAVAGNFASRSPSEPLTGKQIVGIESIPNQPLKSQRVDAQSFGVMVVSQDRDGVMRVKHAVTTAQDPTPWDRELSVQAQEDRMVRLVEDTIRSSDLIGGILNIDSAELVRGAVDGALAVASNADLIEDYRNVQYLVDDTQPTVINVRWEWLAAMPMNYVLLQFALNTESGAFAETTAPA